MGVASAAAKEVAAGVAAAAKWAKEGEPAVDRVGLAGAAADPAAAGEAVGLTTRAISASRSAAGDGGIDLSAAGGACQELPLAGPKPAAALGGLNECGDLKDAARSAARRQRLVGAAASGAPTLLLLPDAVDGSASSEAAAAASAAWLWRSADRATRPGVAAGCSSMRSSDATSCRQGCRGGRGG